MHGLVYVCSKRSKVHVWLLYHGVDELILQQPQVVGFITFLCGVCLKKLNSSSSRKKKKKKSASTGTGKVASEVSPFNNPVFCKRLVFVCMRVYIIMLCVHVCMCVCVCVSCGH